MCSVLSDYTQGFNAIGRTGLKTPDNHPIASVRRPMGDAVRKRDHGFRRDLRRCCGHVERLSLWIVNKRLLKNTYHLSVAAPLKLSVFRQEITYRAPYCQREIPE